MRRFLATTLGLRAMPNATGEDATEVPRPRLAAALARWGAKALTNCEHVLFLEHIGGV